MFLHELTYSNEYCNMSNLGILHLCEINNKIRSKGIPMPTATSWLCFKLIVLEQWTFNWWWCHKRTNKTQKPARYTIWHDYPIPHSGVRACWIDDIETRGYAVIGPYNRPLNHSVQYNCMVIWVSHIPKKIVNWYIFDNLWLLFQGFPDQWILWI